jgi:hypothetical protein
MLQWFRWEGGRPGLRVIKEVGAVIRIEVVVAERTRNFFGSGISY